MLLGRSANKSSNLLCLKISIAPTEGEKAAGFEENKHKNGFISLNQGCKRTSEVALIGFCETNVNLWRGVDKEEVLIRLDSSGQLFQWVTFYQWDSCRSLGWWKHKDSVRKSHKCHVPVKLLLTLIFQRLLEPGCCTVCINCTKNRNKSNYSKFKGNGVCSLTGLPLFTVYLHLSCSWNTNNQNILDTKPQNPCCACLFMLD